MKIKELKDLLDRDGYEAFRDLEPSEIKDEILRDKIQTVKALLWEIDDYIWENEDSDDDYTTESEEEQK